MLTDANYVDPYNQTFKLKVMIGSVYLYYSRFLSIQQHTLCHTDQSRGYMECCLYSVLNTAAYSLHRTIPQRILYVI